MRGLEITTGLFIEDSSVFNKRFFELNEQHGETIVNYIERTLMANVLTMPNLGINKPEVYQPGEVTYPMIFDLRTAMHGYMWNPHVKQTG